MSLPQYVALFGVGSEAGMKSDRDGHTSSGAEVLLVRLSVHRDPKLGASKLDRWEW